MRRTLVVVSIVVGLATAGCASHYTPKRQGIAVYQASSGRDHYVKNGEPRPGSNLADLVADNPAAEASARKYARRRGVGVALTVLGAGGLVGVGAWDESGDPSEAAVYALSSVGLSALISGIVLIVNGEGYKYDAINIYNDAQGWTPPSPEAPDAPHPPTE